MKEIPKSLLKVGEKSIIEHNIDRLIRYGVKNFHISINHFGDKIESHFKDRQDNGIAFSFVKESQPLGTAGAIRLIRDIQSEVVLLMNADLLTNIDFGSFYQKFMLSGADMAVATVPHRVDMPYAIIESADDRVISLQEKPTYTYFANAGIYLMKNEVLKLVPQDTFFNATDLMDAVLAKGMRLIHYPILEYWLDIGRINDYEKAQEDIRFIKL